MKRKTISLPKGGDLDFQFDDDFLKKLQEHFELDSEQEVTDDHIRMFVFGSLKNAVDKAQDGKWIEIKNLSELA